MSYSPYPPQHGHGRHTTGAQHGYQQQAPAQYPQHAYVAPPVPPAPKQRRKWPWIVGGVVLLLVIIGNVGGNSDRSTAPRSVPAADAPAQAAAPAAEEEAPVVTAPSGTIPDGSWLVPSEVAPGQYRSAGVDEGIIEYCQITTYDANGKVLEWKNVGNAGAPLLVTVSKNAVSVTNSGCATFNKVG